MHITVYKTDQSGLRLQRIIQEPMRYQNTDVIHGVDHSHDVESSLINLHPDVEYQRFGGMGGAINDTTATNWVQMPKELQEQFVQAYFDPKKGIGYHLTRVCIGSCDFSAADYTYTEDGDVTLDTFSLAHDEQAVFPLIRAANQYTALKVLASPWSPPAYMKTNNSRIGGKLKSECYELWAKYFMKYIDVCREHGISIWGVTIQNEPRHHQLWESCLYTPDEEAEFLGVLGKELEGAGVKILCYDHCRERVYERAKQIFAHENGKYCDGIANHWYSGDHFGELRAFYHKFPDKISYADEGCCAIVGVGIREDVELPHAERYAHDIMGAFRNGLTHYCDWSMLLNDENGPYHNREGRGCNADAAVFYDRNSGRLVFRLAYYYIGHISKFVRPGARVIACSSYAPQVECVAFKNPDNTVVAVLLNRTDKSERAVLRLDNHIKELELTAHSIVTAVIG
ncbi:MAG: glucosylceramidase [Clostridia bacterium]|nr:glucosylceramidase [Clostridia bacterium]